MIKESGDPQYWFEIEHNPTRRRFRGHVVDRYAQAQWLNTYTARTESRLLKKLQRDLDRRLKHRARVEEIRKRRGEWQ